jgi:hypothetical protein
MSNENILVTKKISNEKILMYLASDITNNQDFNNKCDASGRKSILYHIQLTHLFRILLLDLRNFALILQYDIEHDTDDDLTDETDSNEDDIGETEQEHEILIAKKMLRTNISFLLDNDYDMRIYERVPWRWCKLIFPLLGRSKYLHLILPVVKYLNKCRDPENRDETEGDSDETEEDSDAELS